MKYIKTYENFNYQPVNEELFGLWEKIKGMYSKAKEVVDKIVQSMSPEELQDAANYLSDKGLTPELAKQAAEKLGVEKNEPSPEVAEDIAEIVEVETSENSKYLKEGVEETVKFRLIKWLGMPALTTFFAWLYTIAGRAAAIGWASEPKWITDIHDALGGFGGPLAFILVAITFILFIITVMKMTTKGPIFTEKF